MAMRCSRGNAVVLRTLNRARELYQNKLQAECALAESQPGRTEFLPFNTSGASPSRIAKFDENSTLAGNGRRQLVLDAFEDGSSFICLRCGCLSRYLRNGNDSTK